MFAHPSLGRQDYQTSNSNQVLQRSLLVPYPRAPYFPFQELLTFPSQTSNPPPRRLNRRDEFNHRRSMIVIPCNIGIVSEYSIHWWRPQFYSMSGNRTRQQTAVCTPVLLLCNRNLQLLIVPINI